MNFSFLLASTFDPSSLISFGLIAVLIAFFYFFMIRPQKKKEQEDQQMRDALCVGDEVTTIGGIIGKVISIKDETFVLETTKAKTRIRFLKGAIRSVDVRITDTLAPKPEEAPKVEEAPAVEPAPVVEQTAEKAGKKKKKAKKVAAQDDIPAVEETVVEADAAALEEIKAAVEEPTTDSELTETPDGEEAPPTEEVKEEAPAADN